MANSDIFTIRMTDTRAAQIRAIEQVTGLQGPAAVIDFALATTLAQYRAQEVRTMDAQITAEAIYIEIYGDIDDRNFRAEKTAEIQDWLDDGDIDADTTLPELVVEWRNYGGDDDIIDSVGADDWPHVEITFHAMSEAEIASELDKMFPDDDNVDLAERIHRAIN